MDGLAGANGVCRSGLLKTHANSTMNDVAKWGNDALNEMFLSARNLRVVGKPALGVGGPARDCATRLTDKCH
jgi:hypothetical protein